MSLRFKLLLVALSTLALPWAGWQFVRQVELLLRQGQEQALLASAGMLAKTVEARGIAWPPAGAVLYLQRAAERIAVDGYADDWSSLRPYAQALGPGDDAQKLRATIARDRDMLYLLAEVRDATRARFDPADARSAFGDYVDLVLVDGAESRRYRLTSAAPGAFEAPAQGEGERLPAHLSGMLQEDGSGYRIELRLPRGVMPERIGLAVHDSAFAEAAPAEPRRVIAYDEGAARSLQPLVPAHTRTRLVAADGWLVADAGRLDAAGVAARDAPGGFGNFVYRVLIAPGFGGSATLDGERPRLDASEVWQALSGVPATSWRAVDRGGAVVLTAAIPLQSADGQHGALVIEQANRALPLLANRALVGLAGSTLVALAIALAILLAFGASLSWRIRRLRRLSGKPAALEEIWLDAGIAAGFKVEDVSESLYLYYRQKLNLWIVRAEDRIGLGTVPEWRPQEFGMAAGAPAPQVLRISQDQQGAKVEISHTWFDPEVARYVARLK